MPWWPYTAYTSWNPTNTITIPTTTITNVSSIYYWCNEISSATSSWANVQTMQQYLNQAQTQANLDWAAHQMLTPQNEVPNPHEGREYAAAIARNHPRTAQERARELLLSHLNPDQRHTFENKQWFIVEGGKSKKRYRIRANASMVMNIDLLEMCNGKERVIQQLCAHLHLDAAPLPDHYLSQKLMLEGDEDAFLRIANRRAA
jgi:hypothetical protein